MKTAVSVAAIVFLAANVPSAHARIGDSVDHMTFLAGRPVDRVDTRPVDFMAPNGRWLRDKGELLHCTWFEDADSKCDISAAFRDGRCVTIRYADRRRGRLTEEEVKDLLNKNRDGQEWVLALQRGKLACYVTSPGGNRMAVYNGTALFITDQDVSDLVWNIIQSIRPVKGSWLSE